MAAGTAGANDDLAGATMTTRGRPAGGGLVPGGRAQRGTRALGARMASGVSLTYAWASRGAGRVSRLVAMAFAMALVPASAAAAATPLAAGKTHGRNAGQVVLGLVVIVVILALLYLLFRMVRKRTRG
jgi:hypothetical protein